LVLFFSLASACSAAREAPLGETRDASATDAANVEPDAGELDAGVDAATCIGSPLHAVDESKGVLEEIYVDLPTGQGGTVPFIVDMGGAFSYWTSAAAPDAGMSFVPDAGTTSISCVSATLPSLSGATLGTTEDGTPFAGALGVDLVTRGGVLDLRIRDGELVWLRETPPAPANATTLPLTLHTSNNPYASNRLVASGVQLDGKDVRLMLDTGSPHVLIISAAPRPNETMIQTEDGNGEPVTLYTSTIEIALGGGAKHTVTVDRAASFPTLEKVFAALDDGVTGLLGLDALGHDRIVIAKDTLTFVP
jgi:hypothetical protein